MEALLGVQDRIIGGRVPASLLQAAKARSGIDFDWALLLCALANGLVILTGNLRDFDLMGQILPRGRALFHRTAA